MTPETISASTPSSRWFPFPAGDPESQLEPFIATMEADGWSTRRDSLEDPRFANRATDINGVVTFHKGNLGLRVVTTGGTDGEVTFMGACANSPAFKTSEFDFASQDTIPVG